MAKKRVVKKKVKKKSSISSRAHKAKIHRSSLPKKTISHRASHIGESNTEKILIENFVSLQKVMVNLSVKFDNLSSQISRLLDLFEISAKALAEKGSEMGVDNKDIIKKMDDMLEQNKVIARGVALMHEGPGGSRGFAGRSGSSTKEMGPLLMPNPSVQPPQRFSQSQTPPIKRRVVEQEPDFINPNESPSKFKPLPKE